MLYSIAPLCSLYFVKETQGIFNVIRIVNNISYNNAHYFKFSSLKNLLLRYSLFDGFVTKYIEAFSSVSHVLWFTYIYWNSTFQDIWFAIWQRSLGYYFSIMTFPLFRKSQFEISPLPWFSKDDKKIRAKFK